MPLGLDKVAAILPIPGMNPSQPAQDPTHMAIPQNPPKQQAKYVQNLPLKPFSFWPPHQTAHIILGWQLTSTASKKTTTQLAAKRKTASTKPKTASTKPKSSS
jgi:hypothetical protein